MSEFDVTPEWDKSKGPKPRLDEEQPGLDEVIESLKPSTELPAGLEEEELGRPLTLAERELLAISLMTPEQLARYNAANEAAMRDPTWAKFAERENTRDERMETYRQEFLKRMKK